MTKYVEEGEAKERRPVFGEYEWLTYDAVAGICERLATSIERRDMANEVVDDTLPPASWDFETADYSEACKTAMRAASEHAEESSAAAAAAAAAASSSAAGVGGDPETDGAAAAAASPTPRDADESGSGVKFRAVGCMSKNRLEMVLLDNACYRQAIAPVPLYDSLGDEALAYIIGVTSMKTVFASAAEAKKLCSIKGTSPSECATLTTIVCFDEIEAALKEAAERVEVTLVHFDDVTTLPEGVTVIPPNPPKSSDICTVCFTSGTTGVPKGVVVPHGSLLASASGPNFVRVVPNADDVYLSYLPLAHLMERLLQCAMAVAGGRIGMYTGDPRNLREDLQMLRPTLFVSVPRLFSRFETAIRDGARAKGFISNSIFNNALTAKQYWVKESGVLTHSLWDGLVMNNVRKSLGLDRVRYMITGSAPIAGDSLYFLRAVFGVPVLEGYGQTENSGAAVITGPDSADNRLVGNVGTVCATAEVRLRAVPALGYRETDNWHGQVLDETGKVVTQGVACFGRGELLIRGPVVTRGYLKQPEKTRETITADGWLCTGDVAMIDGDGHVRIIGRVKEQFKLQQGEYVAPTKVENVYERCRYVMQVWLYGDSLTTHCVAVVVVEPGAAKAWATANGKADVALKDLCTDAAFRAEVKRTMDEAAKEAGLKGFERAAAVHLESEPWTVDNEILTPTFKLKRAEAEKKYKDQIKALYATLRDD